MRSQLKTATLAIALLLLTAAPGRAFAQGEPSKAAAQVLFDKGLRLFKEKKYTEACSKFEASLKLFEAMGTKGKLAECYENIGRTASAWAAYREVAVLAKRAAQYRRQNVANERAARLEKILSYLTVNVPDEARVAGMKITRNGTLILPGAYATAIAVDPGVQKITVTAEGYEPWSSEVSVAPSAKGSVQIPALVKIPEADIIASPDLYSQRNTRRIVGMSAVGVGGVSVVVSLALGLKAKKDYDSAFDDRLCDGQGVCSPAGFKATKDARWLGNIATALGVSGAIIAGIGTYFWLSPGPESAEETQGLSFAPAVGNSSLQLSLSGRF